MFFTLTDPVELVDVFRIVLTSPSTLTLLPSTVKSTLPVLYFTEYESGVK